jgi:hypothetical protein
MKQLGLKEKPHTNKTSSLLCPLILIGAFLKREINWEKLPNTNLRLLDIYKPQSKLN